MCVKLIRLVLIPKCISMNITDLDVTNTPILHCQFFIAYYFFNVGAMHLIYHESRFNLLGNQQCYNTYVL